MRQDCTGLEEPVLGGCQRWKAAQHRLFTAVRRPEEPALGRSQRWEAAQHRLFTAVLQIEVKHTQ